MSDQHRSSEHARVRALLESGRITQSEAELLFAALGENEAQQASEQRLGQRLDRPPGQLSASANSDAGAVPALLPPQPPKALPPHPPAPPRLSPGPANAAQQAHEFEAQGLTTPWLKLSGFCGDLSVTADPALNAPVVTGKATLERTDTGYLIRTPPEASGGGNWLTRLHRAAGDLKVRLPTNMGLELRVAAGDGQIRGVKTVKGSFTGGDFKLSGAETLDLTVTAGDVGLELKPQTGEQRLRATSGDINLTFLPGSSATVSGSATCGDLSLPQNFSRSGGFVGGTFEGTVGAGEAQLELRLTAGDVDVKLEPA